VERVSPAVLFEAGATRALECVEEVNRAHQMRAVAARLVEETIAHRKVGVRDWKSRRPITQLPCRGEECLAKHHRRDGRCSGEAAPIVQCFCTTADRASIETLMIGRRLAECVEPRSEFR